MTDRTPPATSITEDTKIRTDLRTLVAVGAFIGAALIGGTVWLTTVHNDIRGLQADVTLIKNALGLDVPRLASPAKPTTTNGN
jgi:hypothetical protein